MTGPITHWLMQARQAADPDEARDAIDRALLLVRRMHHDHYPNQGRKPMTGAVVLIVPALLAGIWAYRRLIDHLRRSLDE